MVSVNKMIVNLEKFQGIIIDKKKHNHTADTPVLIRKI